jgi:hypothetical protein
MRFACLVVLAVLSAALVLAQSGRGTILGTVTDPTGAVMPQVSVTVTNTDTNVKSVATTDELGNFRTPYLIPGPYSVNFEKAGFKALRRDGIVLVLDATVRVDAELTVGALGQSVEVVANASLLETETSTAGTVVPNVVVVNVPVWQRWVNTFAYLSPSVKPSTWSGSNSNLSVNGQRAKATAYNFDGTSAQSPDSNTDTVSPSIDAVAEFKITTAVPSAEFAHSAGGAINVFIKNGTNEFHGSVFYFNRTKMLRALNYFDRGQPPNWNFTQVGGTAGGPIYFPKIYNGKNKSFFFASYQGTRHPYANPRVWTVPEPRFLNGDFSGYRQIYDPDSTTLNAATNIWSRVPFANNQLPVNRMDPVARKAGAYYPAPNQTSTVNPWGPSNNLIMNPVYSFDLDAIDWRLDQTITDNSKLFFRESWNYQRGRLPMVVTEPAAEDLQYYYPAHRGSWTLGHNQTISSNKFNEVRLGYMRRRYQVWPVSRGQGWAGKLGIPDPGTPNFNLAFPRFDISQGMYPLGPATSRLNIDQVEENYQVTENFTFIRGRHTFKTGYFLERIMLSQYGPGAGGYSPSGVFSFTGGQTAFPKDTASGIPFADFLMGTPSSSTFGMMTNPWRVRFWNHQLYFQDDWKVGRKLTLNLGLRYNLDQPRTAVGDHQSNFDPNAMDYIIPAPYATTPQKGAVVHSEVSGVPKSLSKTQKRNFNPRLGFAYQLTSKTVLRGGFGMYNAQFHPYGLNLLYDEYNTGYIFGSKAGGDPTYWYKLSQGPPKFTYPVNEYGYTPYAGTISSRNVNWWDQNMKLPYTLNWQFSVQRAIISDLMMELAYVGASGVKLINNININQIPVEMTNNTVYQDRQPYKPYIQYGNITYWGNIGQSTYHAGTWKLEKRFSYGLSFVTHFTFSKAIDNVSGDGGIAARTSYNLRLEKARGDFDTTRRWVLSGGYQLPFGPGKRFGGSTKGWKARLIEGYEIFTMSICQSGPWITPGMGYQGVRTATGGSARPDLVPGVPVTLPNWNTGTNRFDFANQPRYYNPAAFAKPADFTLGTAGRNILPTPPLPYTDFAIQKNVSLGERLKLQLRCELEHAFNNPIWSAPNASAGSADFGRITAIMGNWGDPLSAQLSFKLMW